MALGPGKYDDLCTEVRLKAKSLGCILMILDPNAEKGWGFSVQAPIPEVLKLPKLLRHIANEIDRDGPFLTS
jgi:hypothetical protein